MKPQAKEPTTPEQKNEAMREATTPEPSTVSWGPKMDEAIRQRQDLEPDVPEKSGPEIERE